LPELTIIAHTDEVRPGECKVVSANGLSFALYNVDGRFCLSENRCPHKAGPLGDGDLRENIVKCPWHEWRFNVETGECTKSPEFKIKTFTVFVKNQMVCARI